MFRFKYFIFYIIPLSLQRKSVSLSPISKNCFQYIIEIKDNN
jgi:hypothetical protein